MPLSQHYKPSERCSPLVVRYISISFNDGEKQLMDKYIPDGYTAIVIHFTDNEKYIINGFHKYELPNIFFTVPCINNLVFETNDILESLIIICRTSVFSSVFKIRMDLLPNQFFQSFDSVLLDDIYRQMRFSISDIEKINIFEDFISQNYLQNVYFTDEVDDVYNKIISGNINRRISEILNDVKMNHRSFRRLFHQRVGISAKELLRIVRVNYVWDLYRKNPNLNFNDIVYECKFFDQSHFIKDFKKIIGETPKKFFSRNLDNVETFSGKQNILEQLEY